MTHPSKLDLGEYLPYLVNRVGNIIADQFGDAALDEQLAVLVGHIDPFAGRVAEELFA